MICKIEYSENLGPYELDKVAIYDDEKIDYETAMHLINEGKDEAKDYFMAMSSESYQLMKKAVQQAIESK